MILNSYISIMPCTSDVLCLRGRSLTGPGSVNPLPRLINSGIGRPGVTASGSGTGRPSPGRLRGAGRSPVRSRLGPGGCTG